MPIEQAPKFRPALTKEQLSLGSIDPCHVRVLGVVPEIPDFAYPLETANPLKLKNFISTVSDHQQSPIWDWAGELLAQV